MGGLMSTKTPGAVFIGILNSRTAQDDIINRFDLRRIYHCKLFVDCRKMLAAQVAIKENDANGIISITVVDRDRYRARDLAEAHVEELDRLVNSLSTSSARREREFLELRLKTIKDDLDANSRALSQFSSHNAMLNPQSQGQSLIESIARFQDELVKAQTELSGLKTQYADDNVRVLEARARVDELRTQLRKMDGTGGGERGTNITSGQEYPSLRELPPLGVTYSDLSRQLLMQENIYETLTKQYELAKVEEAKEIPPVKVLDEPEVAERKSYPHRSIIVALGTVLSAFASITWILVASMLWKSTKDSPPSRLAQE
jgi:capsule polysaccharide export protein KpsE/RkpR